MAKMEFMSYLRKTANKTEERIREVIKENVKENIRNNRIITRHKNKNNEILNGDNKDKL